MYYSRRKYAQRLYNIMGAYIYYIYKEFARKIRTNVQNNGDEICITEQKRSNNQSVTSFIIDHHSEYPFFISFVYSRMPAQ